MFLHVTGVKRQVLISLCLYVGMISNGYGSAWSGPVIPKLRDLEQSPLPYFLTETQLSLVATMLYLGALTGPYVMAWVSNTKGRKPCLIAAGLVSVMAYVILALTQNLAMLLIGRFIHGFSNGSTCVINLVYIGEMSSPKIRGILLSVYGIFYILGSILLFATGPLISFRGTTYIGASLGLLNSICLLWIPDTPVFYALQGKEEEMISVLKDLGRSQDVDKWLNKKEEFTPTNTKKEWMELFSIRSNRKALFIAVVINIFQSCSGVLAVVFFSAAIFEMAGSSIESNLAMIIIGCFQLIGGMVTPFFIEGPYIMAWVSNTKGRKPCLIAAGLVSVMAYVILALTQNLAMLLIGRYVVGFSNGSISIINLVYIGEMSSPKIRGILLTVYGIFYTLGAILLFATGPFISFMGTTYIGASLGLLNSIGLLWIPDTPVFYALQGKDEKMISVLEDLGRSQDVEKLLKKKEEFTQTNTKKEWMELFSNRSNRKALFIALVINILQHCSGVLAVVFFSAAIFEMAGSSIESNLAMIIIGCFQLIGSMVTPFFIESTGRKRILIISSAVCSLSMFLLGLYFYLDLIENPIVHNIKWLPLVVLIMFYIGYDSGFGIIPNAITGEMFTSNVRSKGSTVTMTTSWLFGFMVTTAFGALLETVGGHVAFWFFSFTCACAVLFTIFFLPETKGKTLLEIQESL